MIKNVACLLYIIGFIYEVRANKASTKVEKQLVQKQENDKIYVELKEIKNEDQNDLINTVSKSHNLTDCKSKIFFGLIKLPKFYFGSFLAFLIFLKNLKYNLQ